MKRYLNRAYRFCMVFTVALLSSALVGTARAVTDTGDGNTVKPANTFTWSRENAAHLLRRAGFGGTPEQIDKFFALGRDAAVTYLIDGTLPRGADPVFAPVKLDDFTITPPPELTADEKQTLAAARTARLAGGGKAAQGPQTKPAAGADDPAVTAARALRNKTLGQERQNLQELKVWWVDRMIRTDRPLDEKMTLFWHGLFTSGLKEVKSGDTLCEQDALFHKEAMGNYKQLTDETIHGAAMLRYLNNDENLKGKPNENLARELMELFTMGEGQGYTETDIKQVALALTGLSPVGGPLQTDGTVVLRPRVHDNTVKTIFGNKGNFGPDDVVTLIFAQPQPAHHLALKLWEFYAYPDPSDADLAPVVAALKQSNYELKPALKAMFTSPAFYSDKAKFVLIKSPVELSVEEFRTLNETPTQPEEVALVNRMAAMNQELFQPPNVRGWVGGDNWITAATLYTRYNTSSADVNGTLRPGAGGAGAGGGAKAKANPQNMRQANARLPRASANAIQPATLFASLGATPAPEKVVDAAIDRMLQRPLEPDKRAALVDFIGTEPLKLGEIQSDTRVREMLCLLLSTPEYQVH